MIRTTIFFLVITTAALFASELELDKSQSWIRAKARATGHSFEASPEQFKCEIGLDEQGHLTAASFSCTVSDLVTGKKKRDKEMWHWLESDQFGSIGFVMKALVERDGQNLMVGDFVLHNVHQTLEIPIVVEASAGTLKINGEVAIDTTQFDLPIIRKFGFLTVKPMVTVVFQLFGHTRDQSE